MAVSAIASLASTVAGVASVGGAASLAFGGTLGFLGTSTLAMAASHFLVTTALGAALNALTPKPRAPVDGGYSVNSKGGALNHQIIYGETKVGGAILFDGTTGDNNKYLQRIIGFAGHEVDEFVEFYINDARVTQLDSDGNVAEVEQADGTLSTRYDGYIRILTKTGKSNQSAMQQLIDDYAGEPEQLWTSDHMLCGIAYAYVRFQYSRDRYPNGIPTITAKIRGKKVFDPRTEATVWSDNAALCMADYLTAEYGVDDDANNVDYDNVAIAANICDQTASDNTTRYTMNGAFTTSSTPYDFLSEGLTAMGGLLWFAQGKWRMKAASWTTPVGSFDENDLRSNVQIATRHSRRDNFNAVKGTFLGPQTGYILTDYPEKTNHTATDTSVGVSGFDIGDFYEIATLGSTDWNTVAGTTGRTYAVGDIIQANAVGTGSGVGYSTYDFFLAVDNGQRSVMDFNLPFTDNYEACKRLARIALERNRQQLTVDATFSMKMFGVQVGDNIQLTVDRMGWVSKTFEIVAWTFVGSGEELQIRTTLREISAEVFDDKDDGEIYEKDNTVLPNPFFVQEPDTLAFESISDINEDGTTISGILFTWDHPAADTVEQYEIQWKRSSQSTYKKNAILRETEFELSPVKANRTFDWRVRAINALGIESNWVAGGTSSAQPDTTVPNNPSNIAGQGNYNTATVSWDNPEFNTDGTALTDLEFIKIYRQIGGTYTVVGQAAGIAGERGTFTESGLSAATTYQYRVTAVDYSGNEGSNSSTVTLSTLSDPNDAALGATSVVPIYASDAAGSNQSYDPDPGGVDREFVNYYEYNTTDGQPTLPVTGVTFVQYVGTGQSIWPIYARDSNGDSPSLTQGTRTWVNWYEKVTAPTINTGSDLIDGNPSSDLTWVLFEGPEGPQGDQGADGQDGADGERGSGDFTVFVTTLPTTSSEADTKFKNKTGLTPVENDLAKFTRTSDNVQSAWIYDNPSSGANGWVEYETIINGNLLVDGSLNARDKITGGTITGDLIEADTVLIEAGRGKLGLNVVGNAQIDNLAVNTLKIADYSVSVIESSVGSTNRDVDIIFNNNSGAQAELLVMSVVNLSTPPSTGYNVTYQLLKINAGTGSETVLYERNWTGSVENPGQTVSTYQDFTALSSTTVNDGITRTLRSSIQGGISGGAINIFQNDLIIFARFK